MRRFHLDRAVDISGSSGTGIVAEGVEFSNGYCALTWRTLNTSVAFYPNMATLEAIHNGQTRVVYLDPPAYPLAA